MGIILIVPSRQTTLWSPFWTITHVFIFSFFMWCMEVVLQGISTCHHQGEGGKPLADMYQCIIRSNALLVRTVQLIGSYIDAYFGL